MYRLGETSIDAAGARADGLPGKFHEIGGIARSWPSEKDPFDPNGEGMTEFGREHLMNTEHSAR